MKPSLRRTGLLINHPRFKKLSELPGLRQRACRTSRNSPIHQERLAGDVGAGVRSEENDRAFEICGLARSLERNALAKIRYPFLVLVHDRILSRLEPTRREAIHGDAMRPPIIGETHRELFDAPAAGAVGSEAGVTKHRGDRANVNHAAIFAL